MVLRPEAVKARLLRLEEVVSRLDDLAAEGPDTVRRGFRDAWAAERGLQVAAEIVFDIGNHILTAHFGSSATDYLSVDPDRVAEALGKAPSQFSEFAAAIRAWLERTIG